MGLLVLAGCAGDDESPAAGTSTSTAGDVAATGPTTSKPLDQKAAGEFIKQMIEYSSDGQHGRRWDELHPALQAVIPKTLYVKCQTESDPGVEVTKVTVKETYLESTDIPGTTLTNVPSVAVTLELTARIGEREETDTQTAHAFFVDGRWRHAVRDPEPYKSGQCPD